jgi:hypothetical protein
MYHPATPSTPEQLGAAIPFSWPGIATENPGWLGASGPQGPGV